MTLTRIRTAAASSLAAAGLLFTLAACSTPAATQPSTSAPASTAAASTAAASSSAATEPCPGIKVIVDSGALKQSAANVGPVCVPADGPVLASKVLDQAKVKTEGTDAYPKELVCRVNGVPAADFDITHKGGTYREECKKMPAAFAYWSLWVKPASGAWAYAQEGLATLKVSPGQSLELLYTLDGKPAAPTP